MYKISVIIPVYNASKYIDKCLKSLEKQTQKDKLKNTIIITKHLLIC